MLDSRPFSGHSPGHFLDQELSGLPPRAGGTGSAGRSLRLAGACNAGGGLDCQILAVRPPA